MKNKGKKTLIENKIERGESVEIFIDGKPIKAHKRETIATALLNAGYFASRTIDSKPMGVYCNIGVCYNCVMTVNGFSSVRICKTLVTDGCRVESQHFRKGRQDES